ncbi:hypothetical protein [Planococcus dechangensis]|uniref:Uncharacterized protein n=1 Tax=Planococcus dechangensis TaxID=1176255 RepID=A0ABV9MDG1_9BACL
MTDYSNELDRLRTGELQILKVPKEEFLEFRKALIEQEDFKHFRGTAYHHGLTEYEYTEHPSK